MRYAITLLVFAALLSAQERHKLEINAETDEGKLLQSIGQEPDPAKKAGLMEQFLAKYPSHDGAGWVLSQLQPVYMKANDYDKVMAAGEKLVAMDGTDLDAAYASLKAAEGKKDVDLVRKWAEKTSDIARKAAAAPQPGEADQVEAWKQRVDYAKQVDTYTEYAIFAVALANPGSPKTVALYEALEQRYPKGQYLGQLTPTYIVALNQTAPDKVIPAAERILARDPANEDMLLVVADAYMNKKQNDKALAASTKLIETLKAKPKPENIPQADWDNKKNQSLGRAHWMTGIIYADQQNWPAADSALRAAVPYIKNNQALEGPAYFYLGLANYRMGKGKNRAQMADALKFSEQSAGIKGPFQGPASQNVKAIREGK